MKTIRSHLHHPKPPTSPHLLFRPTVNSIDVIREEAISYVERVKVSRSLGIQRIADPRKSQTNPKSKDYYTSQNQPEIFIQFINLLQDWQSGGIDSIQVTKRLFVGWRKSRCSSRRIDKSFRACLVPQILLKTMRLLMSSMLSTMLVTMEK